MAIRDKMSHLAIIRVFSLLILMAGWQVAAALTLSLPSQHPGEIGLLKADPAGQSKAMSKVDPMLARSFAEFTGHQQTAPGVPFKSTNPFLRIANGKVLIDAIATEDSEVLLTDLGRFGLKNGSRYGSIVSGRLPLAVIDKAAALQSLRYISASIPLTNAGTVTSQGDAAVRADVARSNAGVDGTGVTVGVLSDSFDQQGGAAADVVSEDLPPSVLILDDSGLCTDADGLPTPCTDEGRGMAQIVHDAAPGADIAFHTAFNGIADFASGIEDLATAGADIIVDDVMYTAEPMFQDGAIANAVDNVANNGVAYFSAAGNAGRKSYEHNWDGSGEILYIEILDVLYPAGEMHDFDRSAGGTDTFHRIHVPSGECMIVVLQWDSPFGSESTGTGTKNDIDMWLTNEYIDSILTFDPHENVPAGEPVEAIQYCNDGILFTDEYVNLIFSLWDGTPLPGLIKYLVYDTGGVVIDEYQTYSGTVFGHANAAGAEAVGASYYLDTPEFCSMPLT